MGNIEKLIGKPALLDQLAEEASELTKAALKLSRILRGENPTPVTEQEAINDLIEEYSDVIQCARELKLRQDEDQIRHKDIRWHDRIKNSILEGVIHEKQNKNNN